MISVRGRFAMSDHTAQEPLINIEKPYPRQIFTLGVLAACLSCWALIILVANQLT